VRRRNFIGCLGSAAVWPLPVRAAAGQSLQHHSIGFLANDPTIPLKPAYLDFLDELREGGFVEGKNVVVVRGFTEAKADRYAELAADLVRREVDVIVTSTDPATLAAKNATTTIPIVMLSTSDPVGQGFVESLSRPGGNVTGLTQDDSAEIAAKRLQLLKLATPHIARVMVLLQADVPIAHAQWMQLEQAAPALNLTLQRVTARHATDFAGVFAPMTQDRPDALLTAEGPLIFVNRRLIMELAARNKLPAMSGQREYTEAGALLSYGSIRRELFRQAAVFIVKILKGAKAKDLPVALPTRHLKTAKALGVAIPPDLFAIADEVIE
jgi:putative tryptophan/tyrosine transport system substrate-binding protein